MIRLDVLGTGLKWNEDAVKKYKLELERSLRTKARHTD